MIPNGLKSAGYFLLNIFKFPKKYLEKIEIENIVDQC